MPRLRSQVRRAVRLRVGIDAGGTFTDLVALGAGVAIALKVPSTPDDPARGVEHALEQLGARLAAMLPAASRAPDLELEIVHGTTVATNALLEGRGARVVLVTNAGFEDLLEIGRQARPDLYDLFPTRPPPLVAREDRLGVDERTLHDGTRARSPSALDLRRLAATVRARAPGAIAIGLLHAYANPAAEKDVETALAPLGTPISRSSAVAPLFREYERFSTTVANAALVPLCRAYLERLARSRRAARLFVMQSNGGWTSARAAARTPVRLVLSGPAGGLAAAHARLRAARAGAAITLDLGGTSTDVGLVQGGGRAPARTDHVDLDGRPILADALEIHSIGAGGGSLLWIDAGGSLRVGPRSAGADPGPACYGRGERPCLTDAHVLLGRLPLREKLGGAITLQPERSQAAIAPLARALRVTPRELAAAALDVADAAMEQAVKKVTLERGHDPRRCALFAFGGAGGLHACRLARRLELREVIVPPVPGATSAWGMATSDARLSSSQGLVRLVEPRTLPEITRAMARLADRARADLLRELGPGPVALERTIACRYVGQSFELEVPFGPRLAAAFETRHHERYGFRLAGTPVQCVALHAAAVRRSPGLRGAPPERRAARSPAPTTPVWLQRGARLVRQPVLMLRREELAAGRGVRGPCLVLESTATTVVEPGFTLRVDRTGCLRIVAS